MYFVSNDFNFNTRSFIDGWGLGFYFLCGHFQPCGRVFNLCKCYHNGCLYNHIFPNLGSCAACSAHSMCHNELWLISMRKSKDYIPSPFSFVLFYYIFMDCLLLQYVALLQSRELVLEKRCTDIELLSPMIYVHCVDPHFYVISLLFCFLTLIVTCGFVYYVCEGKLWLQ